MLSSFPTSPEQAGSGKLVGFLSLAEGAGATALACMTALALGSSGQRVALVDLRREGKVRAYMGLTPDVCPANVLDAAGVRLPEDVLRAGVDHPRGVFVLPGVTHPLDAAQVDASLVLKVLVSAKRVFDVAVAVFDSVWDTGWLGVLASDLLFLVVRPATESIDLFAEGVDLIGRLGAGERLKIVVNQAGAPGSLSESEVRSYVRPDAVIPYSARVQEMCNKRLVVPVKGHGALLSLLKEDGVVGSTGLDQSLVNILAVRSGLVKEVDVTPERYEGVRDVLGREEYVRLRDRVREASRQHFKLEETARSRDPVVRGRFRSIALNCMRELKISVGEPDVPALVQALFDDILGFGPLEKYFSDPEVTEVKVNGAEIRVEKRGREEVVPERFESVEHARQVVERMIAPTGRRLDLGEPCVDARLFDGSRLIAQIAPIAVDGVLVSVRRFRQDISAERLIRLKAASSEVMKFLQACVVSKLNIVVSGGTSSGKTTLLNCLASFIPKNESVVTIEDPAELQLQHPDVRRLEARRPNIEGKGEVTMRDLVAQTLRMAPKRVIVGECRKGEAFDMLQAMNTGHPGSMTTVHANSGWHCISRLVNLVQQAGMDLPYDAILDQIADSIDVIVHVGRDRAGHRRIEHVVEVAGVKKTPEGRTVKIELNELWRYSPQAESFAWVAKECCRAQTLLERGGYRCPSIG